MEIRLAQPHELEVALGLVKSRAAEPAEGGDLLKATNGGKRKVFVAVDGGRLVGTVTSETTRHLWILPKLCYVSDMAVHPSFEGKSVGMQLMRAGVHDARKQGYRKLIFDAKPELFRFYDAVSRKLKLRVTQCWDPRVDYPARYEVEL